MTRRIRTIYKKSLTLDIHIKQGIYNTYVCMYLTFIEVIGLCMYNVHSDYNFRRFKFCVLHVTERIYRISRNFYRIQKSLLNPYSHAV